MEFSSLFIVLLAFIITVLVFRIWVAEIIVKFILKYFYSKSLPKFRASVKKLKTFSIISFCLISAMDVGEV